MRKLAIPGLVIPILFMAGLFWLGYFASDPFTAVPAAGGKHSEHPVAAVLLSGDMGLKVGMGPEIANALTARGIPVVGINSLTYFRAERSPAEIAGIIAQGIERARKLARTDSVIVIGQSFGADMLHIGLAGLPAAQRKYIRMAVLIVPTEPIYRQVSFGELTGLAVPTAQARETVSRLNWVPVLCIYGKEETDSVCPSLALPNVHRVALPGGHRLRFDPTGLLRALGSAIGASLQRGP